ncbi:MAG: DUF6197 family protein [Casimicrobium sp.]
MSNIAAAEILESAATVIRLGFWARGAGAKNKSGKSVGSSEKSACTWCAGGATHQAARALGASDRDLAKARAALRRSLRLKQNEGIPSWNDATVRTANEVADAMDRAAEEMRK